MIKTQDTLSLVEKTWRFDSNVAKKFDTHVQQSIPHYLDLQHYTVKLSEWFLKDNTLVYDLGCSTGETIKQILNLKSNFKSFGIVFLSFLIIAFLSITFVMTRMDVLPIST